MFSAACLLCDDLHFFSHLLYCTAACLCSALPAKQCAPFYAWFYALANRCSSCDTDPAFCPSFIRSSPGKSVVSEPKDEVQAAEVGGGGLGVSAEEEGLASHKPVETGD